MITETTELNLIPLTAIQALCGLSRFLYEEFTDARDSRGHLLAFARVLEGTLTWSTRVETLLEEDVAKALLLATYAPSGAIPSHTTEKLDRAWRTLVEKWERQKSEVATTLDRIPSDASEALREGEALQARVEAMRLPSQRPLLAPATRNALEASAVVEQATVDATNLLEYAALETEEALQKLHELGSQAWQRISTQVTRSKGKVSEHEKELFLALPRLVLERQVEVMQRIVDAEDGFDSIQLAEQWRRLAVERRPNYMVTRLEPERTVSSKWTKLSRITQAYVDEVGPAALPANEERGVQAILERVDGLIREKERATALLASAKALPPGSEASALLGAGLLARGRVELRNGKVPQGRRLLLDALACIVASQEPVAAELVGEVVDAIVVAWVWPLLGRTAGSFSNETIGGWLDHPDAAYAAAMSLGRLDIIARIWAQDLTSESAAEEYLQVVSAHLGNDVHLLRRCARALLRPAALLSDPLRAVSRLSRLLKLDYPVEDIEPKLTQAANEIINLSESAPAARRKLSDIADQLEAELGAMTRRAGVVTPVGEIVNELPGLLRSIASREGQLLAQPQVTTRSLVQTLYVSDQSREVALPFVVSNAHDATSARNVSATLLFLGDTYGPEMIQDRVLLGNIDGGEEREAIFHVQTPPALASHVSEWKLRVALEVSERAQAHDARIAINHSSTRGSRGDPYNPGVAVRGDELFVGRTREMEELRSSLVTDNPKRAILVHGIRRIGKTSLLHRLQHDPEIQRNYSVLFWDVEDRPKQDTSGAFMCDLAWQIREAVPRDYWSYVHFHRDDLRKNPFPSFETFTRSIDALPRSPRILLMIDEFDHLLQLAYPERDEKSGQEGFEPEVFGAIRKALMTTRFLHIVFCGLPRLLRHDYHDRLFGLMHPVPVRSLSEAEANSIIDAANTTMKPTPAARKLIHRLTGRQPYLLQALCSNLFVYMRAQGRETLTCFDVEEVVAERMAGSDITRDYQNLISDADWPLLRALALAHRDVGGGSFVSSAQVASALRADGKNMSDDEVQAALTRLAAQSEAEQVERPLVVRAPNHLERFQLVIGLLGRALIGESVHGY